MLPLASLPSRYGIGDIGSAAKTFVDFLAKGEQSLWQILPINPISEQSSYSPYGSYSAMAGNILLLDPSWFCKQGLVTSGEIKHTEVKKNNTINYTQAERRKNKLFDTAWDAYKKKKPADIVKQYHSFCTKEKSWLDDFASYVVLKKNFNNLPWYSWPTEYAGYNKKAIKDFVQEHSDEYEKVKWLQFAFALQWEELKMQCKKSGIQLFGDMPFYVGSDSVDVWSNRDIFNIANDGTILKNAGVPPDYFSETGQLWNMPTFRWDLLHQQGYEWWIRRLAKNLEYFDLLRLDHFRAFHSYWEVPEGATTAIDGKWVKGPATNFFKVAEKHLPGMPFVAEDLGDNMEGPYVLRERLKFPGMKVLQFAFGDNMATSVDIPHNYIEHCIAYTGTHDNNTTKGWYTTEADNATKKRLAEYYGRKISKEHVHLDMIRMVYSSVAKTAIIPIQDVLGLEGQTRINTPGTDKSNWLWRLTTGQINDSVSGLLAKWAKLYNRSNQLS